MFMFYLCEPNADADQSPFLHSRISGAPGGNDVLARWQRRGGYPQQHLDAIFQSPRHFICLYDADCRHLSVSQALNLTAHNRKIAFSPFQNSSAGEESVGPRTLEPLVQSQGLLPRQNDRRRSVSIPLPGHLRVDRLLHVQPAHEHRTFRHAHVHRDLSGAVRTRNRTAARRLFRHPSCGLPGPDGLHPVRSVCRFPGQPELRPLLHVVDDLF